MDIELVTQEEVGGYRRSEIIESKPEGAYLFWATNALWSNDGKFIAYLSNRGNVGTGGLEVWIADLSTGTEKRIYSSLTAMGLYGWTQDGNIVIWEKNKGDIKIIDLSGVVLKTLFGSADNVTIDPSGTKLIYTKTRPSTDIWMYDLSADTPSQIASAKGIEFESNVEFSPSGDRLSYLEYTGVAGERRIHVYDFIVQSYLEYDVPNQFIASSVPEWIDENTLLLNGQSKNGESSSWMLTVEMGGNNNGN